MIQATHEGVIKFQLDFHAGPPPQEEQLRELNAWRNIFLKLGLLGQDPQRYDGYGFGNLSRRLPGRNGDAFLISGTQTGHMKELLPEHYATVHACNPAANKLSSSGQIQPSSEALSHGVLYHCNPQVNWVMHLHNAEIFACREQLGLPCTDPAAGYGTPEMAEEILRLARNHEHSNSGLLIMTGHQDGILAYGDTAEKAGSLAVVTLALALQKGC